jgi:hypothetical protein
MATKSPAISDRTDKTQQNSGGKFHTYDPISMRSLQKLSDLSVRILEITGKIDILSFNYKVHTNIWKGRALTL